MRKNRDSKRCRERRARPDGLRGPSILAIRARDANSGAAHRPFRHPHHSPALASSSAVSPFQNMAAYLGGSAIQTVGDNPVTAYRQLVQQFAKDVDGTALSPKQAERANSLTAARALSDRLSFEARALPTAASTAKYRLWPS